ncbi:hypothetical protein [Lacibacter sp.]|uniref:hypothetical protein n=1 Tax=Lacibacter sp. TaxID=1915409 RepID=UPI002B4B90B7|nr:hypothetical protein [Lacibacter sp.]HLP35968.1 hypothetical protein [Lacibacter sp.]
MQIASAQNQRTNPLTLAMTIRLGFRRCEERSNLIFNQYNADCFGKNQRTNPLTLAMTLRLGFRHCEERSNLISNQYNADCFGTKPAHKPINPRNDAPVGVSSLRGTKQSDHWKTNIIHTCVISSFKLLC